MGEAIKALGVPRENLVVSTKIFWGPDKLKVNALGLSRKHILEGI
jgi:aryl-alcohol dehydrogenase-like predicted oxidoreductase